MSRALASSAAGTGARVLRRGLRRHVRKPLRRLAKRVRRLRAAACRRLRGDRRSSERRRQRERARRIDGAHAVVLSYPKSGRTWVRYVLAQYLSHQAAVPFDLRLNRARGVAFEHGLRNGRPGVQSADALMGKRLVVLVRDPRDVAVSLYHHKRDRGRRIDCDLAEFLDTADNGIERQSRFVLDLLDLADRHSDVHVMSYEDLRRSTEREMRRFLAFVLGEEVEEAPLRRALEATEFDNMRRFEVELHSGESTAASASGLADERWDGNPEGLKVRRGEVGGFRAEMDDELQADVASRPMTRRLLARLEGLRSTEPGGSLAAR